MAYLPSTDRDAPAPYFWSKAEASEGSLRSISTAPAGTPPGARAWTLDPAGSAEASADRPPLGL